MRVGSPSTAVVGDGAISDLAARADEQVRSDLAGQLVHLADLGEAGAASFDAAARGFRVELTDRARDLLASSRLVAAVVPASAAAPAADEPANRPLAPLTSTSRSAQSVGSVNFVQVYTPFMWGRTNVGGLSVELTLETSGGQVKGVAAQKYQTPPNDSVKIDRTQLYYETVFKDPSDSTHTQVATILPGDRVHVVTTGVDPSTGAAAVEDKRIVVDDVQAWTSYDGDAVSGTAPPGANLTVTVGTALWLSSYVTPGNQMTYADTTADGSGRFSVAQFRSSADATLKKVDLAQGTTGYVRLKHSDGNEVYTVHGQNVMVLENSALVHGYAFPLPTSPLGLDVNVPLSHPYFQLTVTLKDAAGGVKDTWTTAQAGSFFAYQPIFTRGQIAAGDSLEVKLGGGPTRAIPVLPLTSRVDLAGNQIVGTAPANTPVSVQAGRIAGYISASSYFDFLSAKVTSDGSGSFASGTFACGTTNQLHLGPGSFGYVGVEDDRGNFIYEALAAPTTHTMVDYPFVEGWLPDGAARPALTVVGADGATKHSSTVRPTAVWLVNQRLWINVYYNATTAQPVVPGDVVSLAQPSGTATVPVDRLSGFVDVDDESVFGDAPAGSTVRVIPKSDRWSYRDATAGSAARFAAVNPYRNFVSFTCAEQDRTLSYDLGGSGRVYLQHPDGNAVFAHFGRTMSVNQNEQTVELWPFVLRDVDWFGPAPVRPVTVTLTPRDGSPPVSATAATEQTDAGHVKVDLVDAQGRRVVIRAGDGVVATFDEGPTGQTRKASLTMASQPLVLGVPDVEANTVAGVGPRGWGGATMLSLGFTPYVAPVAAGSLTAWGPATFRDAQGKAVPLARGYSGTSAFTSPTGVRVWSAWAAVSLPTRINGWLSPGDTQVCGTAAPNAPLRVHDLSVEANDVVLATGTVDAAGKFCATVPALVKDQVILAEADGTYSQPVVVGSTKRTYLAFTPRATRGVQ